MDSGNDVSSVFDAESNKLFSMVNAGLAKPELPVSEIVEIYYQIINVSSLGTMLLQQFGDSAEHKLLTSKIEKTQRFISEKFNSNLHRTITKHLTDSIANITKDYSHPMLLRNQKKI